MKLSAVDWAIFTFTFAMGIVTGAVIGFTIAVNLGFLN